MVDRASTGLAWIRLRFNGGRVRAGDRQPLYVDPSDARCRMMLRQKGAVDRDAVSAWTALVDDVRPTLVVDVGANFGEVAFSRLYDSQAVVHLVEPNPDVLPYLRRSAAIRQAHLHEVAASDSSGNVSLHVASRSSGLSSLESPSVHHDLVAMVRSAPLDEVFPNVTSHDRVAVKLDVEGHEAAVLRGMRRMLERVREVKVLCEVNDNSMDYILANFRVMRIDRVTGQWTPHSGRRGSLQRNEAFTKDVILLRP